MCYVLYTVTKFLTVSVYVTLQVTPLKPAGAPTNRYLEVLRDRNVMMFAVITFFYHLANAGIIAQSVLLYFIHDLCTVLFNTLYFIL